MIQRPPPRRRGEPRPQLAKGHKVELPERNPMAHEFITLASPRAAVMFNWTPETACCVCAPSEMSEAQVIEHANATAPRPSSGAWRGVRSTAPCNQITGRKHWMLTP